MSTDENPPSPAASPEFAEEVYDELRRRAERLFRSERADHTLQPTALVHEAYLQIAKGPRGGWKDASHFLAVAATTMRRVLVDHARERSALKRGGDRLRVSFVDTDGALSSDEGIDVLEIEDLLQALGELDERKALVAELKLFGGLDTAAACRVVGVARSTLEADWFFARAWLKDRLSAG